MTTTVTSLGFQASVERGGFKVTFATPGLAGNAWGVNIYADSNTANQGVTIAGTTITFVLPSEVSSNTYSSALLYAAWQSYSGADKDNFIVSYDGNDGSFPLVGFEGFFGGAKLTGGADTADLSVTFDKGNANKHDLVAEGTLQITDTEGVASVTAAAGTYGTLTLADPVGGYYGWTYALDPADTQTAALTADATETITLTVTDGNGNTHTHDIEIAITFQESAAPVPPVLAPENTGDDAGAVTEDGGAAATADGVITVTDTDDENSVLTFATALAASVPVTGDPDADHAIPADPDPTAVTTPATFTNNVATVTGTYGAFTLTRDDSGGTLSWSYTLDTGANAIADGQTAYEKLAIRATDDDSNPSVPEVITITITGANDVPVITSADTTLIFADTKATEEALIVSQTGTFIATDADTADTVTFTVTGPASAAAAALTGQEATTYSDFTHKVAGTYGTLYYNEDDGAWQFDPDTDAINALDAGATPTEAFTVTASDGTATSAAKTITIDITGANDHPVQLEDISPPAVADTPFDESSFADIRGQFPATTDPEGDTYLYVVNGRTEINAGTSELLELAALAEGLTHYKTETYGTLFYNEETGAWKYVVDAEAVNGLDAARQGVTDVFMLHVEDADGARPDTAVTSLTITVNGADEHTDFSAGITGARASAFINGIEFRAVTSGVEPNNWAVSFASAGGNVPERDDLDFVFEFTGETTTPDTLDLNGLVFTADGDSGVTVTIVASGGSDAAVAVQISQSVHLAIQIGSSATYQHIIDAVTAHAAANALVTVTTDSPTTVATPTATPRTPLTGGTGAPPDPADLTPARVVGAWNANTGAAGVAQHIKATLQEAGTYTLAEWLDAGASLSGGGDAADLSVTEGSDLHARGFIQVIAADAAVTYGADDDTNATVSGSGASRMVTYQGSFGQLVVDADGDWLYTLGAGVADLDTALDTADGDTFDAGETLTDAFTVTVNDGTTDVEVSITVTVNAAGEAPAQNNAPTLTVVTDATDLAGDVTEDDAATATGALTVADADAGDTADTLIISTAVSSSTAVQNDADADHTAPADPTTGFVAAAAGAAPADVVGAYGTFSFTLTNGVLDWTYTLDSTDPAIQALRAGQEASEKLAVRVADNEGASTTQIITVTITGANDAPVVDAGFAAAASVIVHGVKFTAVDAGDAGNDLNVRLQLTGTSTRVIVNNSTTITLQFSLSATGKTSQDLLNLFNNDGGVTFKNLIMAELVGTTASITESTGLHDLTGGKDGTDGTVDDTTPVISGDFSVSDGDNDEGEGGDRAPTYAIITGTGGNAATATASGTAPDLTYTITKGTGESAVTWGTITLNTATGAWEFTADAAALSGLIADAEEILALQAQVTDAGGGTDTEAFTITLNGANDAPVIDAGGPPTDADYAVADTANNA